MKISRRIRESWDLSTERYTRLESEIKGLLKDRAEGKGWFFFSRLKQLESFALKVETGRVKDVLAMEDFLGCTIVVPNTDSISEAEQLVEAILQVHDRRPKDDMVTWKEPSNFPFDDLRLYCHRGPAASGKDADLDDLPFEIQAKTVLQHAWAIATHDLIYKTDDVSWSKERIAFQVKAMLEHAEIAIAKAEDLAGATALAQESSHFKDLRSIMRQVMTFWPEDQLPKDIKRLSLLLLDLLALSGKAPDALTSTLEAEKARLGTLPANLSPYSFTLQAIANDPAVNLRQQLDRRGKLKIVVSDEMDIPSWLATIEHERVRHV